MQKKSALLKYISNKIFSIYSWNKVGLVYNFIP